MHENQNFFGPNAFIWGAKKVPFSDFIQNMSLAPSMCLFMWIKVDKYTKKSFLEKTKILQKGTKFLVV